MSEVRCVCRHSFAEHADDSSCAKVISTPFGTMWCSCNEYLPTSTEGEK